MAKELPLSRGMVALVDDEDFERLSAYPWCAMPSNRSATKWRARGRMGEYGSRYDIYLHHAILGIPEAGYVIDHINGNALDNRKCNLRRIPHRMNLANRPRAASNTSGFKGVVRTPCNKWTAQIKVNCEHIYLGNYETSEEAAHAYDAAAIRYFGDCACLNFPNFAQVP